MSDAMASMADRLRVERHDMERRMSDGRRRRLRQKLEATHDELEREREARRALADVLGNIEGRRRSRGILRLVIVGGTAYFLGTRAGRDQYDAVMRKVGEIRASMQHRMGDVRARAMDTAQRVPDAMADAAQSIKQDVAETARQVSEDVRAGASKAGEHVSESTGRATAPSTTSGFTPSTTAPQRQRTTLDV